MTAYIKIVWSVKFRAFGITFGNYSDSKVIQLPPVVTIVEQLLGVKSLYTYNDHGINVVLQLQQSPV